MKPVLAIVQDKDADTLAREFIQSNVRATKLATSGDFLKTGNITFIVGVEDGRINEVLEIIRKSLYTKEQYVSNVDVDVASTLMLGEPIQATAGEATVFVLLAEEFKHF